MVPSFKNEVKYLMENSVVPSVSIFLPTHRAGPEIEQAPIRLKNLLRSAEGLLTEWRMRGPEALDFLAPVRKLLEDGFFWRNQGDGLAVFLSPGVFRTYRVPVPLRESLHVGRRFLVKPLIPLLEAEGRFYVLALSQNQVRLVECTRFGVNEVPLEGIPRNLDEMLAEYEPKKYRQVHTRTAAPGGGGLFRTHGAGLDDTKDQVLRFVRKVSDGILPLLKGENAPVVPAGVEMMTAFFREVSQYAYVAEEDIGGNPESLSPGELKDRAWEIVRPHFLEGRKRDLDRCLAAEGTGIASTDLREVLPAAHTGRVETLFVRSGFQRNGVFDLEGLMVHPSDDPGPETDDLVNLAVTATVTHGGNVHVFEPDEGLGPRDIIALFRY
jgi:hypothetical protein